MTTPADRCIELVHHVPGRTRFRLSWIAKAREDARSIAQRLSERAGMTEVRVRPQTGSVLCLHEPGLEPGDILDDLRRITGVDAAYGPGEPRPKVYVRRRGSALGHEMLALFREVDRDILRATKEHLDLASLAVLGFGALGAANTAATGILTLPPWYSLAWWSYHILATVEASNLEKRGNPGAAPPGPPTP